MNWLGNGQLVVEYRQKSQALVEDYAVAKCSQDSVAMVLQSIAKI